MTNQIKFSILTQTFGAQRVDELKSKLGGLGTQAATMNSKLTTAAAGTYLFSKAIEVASKSVQTFYQVIDEADKLNDLSEMTGISATALDQFSNAAKMSGIEVEKAQGFIKKFTSNLGDINNEKVSGALKSLGISVADANGNFKEADVVLKEVADKFSTFEDGSKKAAIASALFGKTGIEFVPTLNLGSKAIESYGTKMSNGFPKQAAAFNDALDMANKKIKEHVIAFSQNYLPSLQTVIDSFNQVSAVGMGDQFAKDIGTATKVLANLGNIVFTVVSSTIDILWSGGKEVYLYFKMFLSEIFKLAGAVGRVMTSVAKGDFKNAMSGFSFVGKDLSEYRDEKAKRSGKFTERFDERLSSMFLFNSLVDSDFKDNSPAIKKKDGGAGPDIENKNAVKEGEALAKYAIAQAEVINKERMKIDNYALSTSELEKMLIAQELHMQALKDTAGWETSAKDAYMATTEAVIKQRQALIDMQEQQKQSFEVGAKQAFKDYIEKVRDVAGQTRDLFMNAFQKMEDSLVNFVKTGKLNFNDLANAIIDAMIRMAVQQATLGIFMSIGLGSIGSAGTSSGTTPSNGVGYLGVDTNFSKSANGNIVGPNGPMPLSFFANGGVVNSPHVAIFGEGTKPEAFVPLPDGRTIPVTMKGGGESVNITVIYNEATGKESSSGSENGKALSTAVAAAVRAEIVNQKRPGGLLS